MTNPGAYKAREMNTDLAREIARLRDQAQWGWDKEARNLGWFGLRDGMAILEVGSGPGFITEQLLALCRRSHVTCVEIDADLTGPADRYLRGRGLAGRYSIAQGDVARLPLPANRFDFAVARVVFQHLPDPAAALREIRRALKPGGKLVITDVDVGLGEIYGPRDAAADAVEAKLTATMEQRGGDPRIGRRLWRLLAAAGYVDLDLEIIPIHSDATDPDLLFPREWDPGAYKAALDGGLMTAADLETMRRAHFACHAAPDKYALFVSVMVGGAKPL
jgi:ubiquinone/menaquinone biosynthesis C-methylase UbiE